MDEQAQGAILVVGSSGGHVGSGVGDCYHPFLIKTLGAAFHKYDDICTPCGVEASRAERVTAPLLPGRASSAPTSRHSRARGNPGMTGKMPVPPTVPNP